tara:strand:- start:563 stop:1846 length:1284 start_codon:yes stop_codon:yes gene_type:complete
MAGPATPAIAGVYYVFVTVAGTAGGIYIKKKGKEAAVKLANKIGGRVYKDGTQRVIGILKSKKNKLVTEGSKVVKDLINKKKSVSQKIGEKVSSVKDKITSVFKRKPKPKVEKKDPTIKINKSSSQTTIKKEIAELNKLLRKKKELTSKIKNAKTKAEKIKLTKEYVSTTQKIQKMQAKNAKRVKDFKVDPKLNKTKTKQLKSKTSTKTLKKGDTMIQKGKKMIWTGTKWTAWTVGVAAALGLGEKVLRSMKTDADNTQIKWQYKGVVYKNYADYKKAVEADKNKKVTKTKNNEIKITNTKTGTEKKVKPKFVTQGPLRQGQRGAHSSVDRVIKKEDVKIVDNKKSNNNNVASKKTSGATTSSSSGGSGTSKSWKDYKTIAAAQRAGSSFFNSRGVKKAAVTKEQLARSGLSLRDYMNKKLGKTRRN